jgi:hypothetical protein
MALSELAALDEVYEVLRPLDAAARRRALQWLSDALGAEVPLASAPTQAGSVATPSTVDVEPKPTRRPRGGRRATEGAPRRRAATAAAPVAATVSRRSRAGRPVAAEPARAGVRAYRRMPPAEKVMAAYRRVGSVSGLAEHFDVPRHTVQGWARQLRSQGYTIGRTR